MKRIAYHPTVELGTTKVSPTGEPVLYVEPERFYVALLAERMSAAFVFEAIAQHSQLKGEALLRVEDAVADVYWNQYDGVLTPPNVLRALLYGSRDDSGDKWLESITKYVADLKSATETEQIWTAHTDMRVFMLEAGARSVVSDEQVAIGEFVADYFMLQRAIAEDIRHSETSRSPGQSRGARLRELNQAHQYVFEEAVKRLLQPKRLDTLVEGDDLAALEAYARRRKLYQREGVLTVFG